MDFTLRQNNSERNRTIQKGVLILVLVDFTLRHIVKMDQQLNIIMS